MKTTSLLAFITNTSYLCYDEAVYMMNIVPDAGASSGRGSRLM